MKRPFKLNRQQEQILEMLEDGEVLRWMKHPDGWIRYYWQGSDVRHKNMAFHVAELETQGLVYHIGSMTSGSVRLNLDEETE